MPLCTAQRGCRKPGLPPRGTGVATSARCQYRVAPSARHGEAHPRTHLLSPVRDITPIVNLPAQRCRLVSVGIEGGGRFGTDIAAPALARGAHGRDHRVGGAKSSLTGAGTALALAFAAAPPVAATAHDAL